MPKTNEKKEEIIDMVEELFIMGFMKPYEVQRILSKNGEQKNDLELKNIHLNTVSNYIDIVRRRIRNKYKVIENSKVLKRELRDLDYMEQQLWQNYKGSVSAQERNGAMNSILKCKARRAKLLGLDTENLNINPPKTLEDLFKENEDTNKQGSDRDVIQDPKQEGG